MFFYNLARLSEPCTCFINSWRNFTHACITNHFINGLITHWARPCVSLSELPFWSILLMCALINNHFSSLQCIKLQQAGNNSIFLTAISCSINTSQGNFVAFFHQSNTIIVAWAVELTPNHFWVTQLQLTPNWISKSRRFFYMIPASLVIDWVDCLSV